MADTVVDSSTGSTVELEQALWGPYWINPLIGALVLRDSGAFSMVAYRTTDGGANWSQITVGADSNVGLVVFFDREVPGDTGTLLHIWWQDETTNTVRYRTLDLSDGSLGTTQTVTSGFASQALMPQAACKTRNGNLLVAGYDNHISGLGSYCFRSTDAGVSWSPISSPFENNSDKAKLYPANTGDGADACLIYYDDSAAELSIKMYDDSADTWTETSISSGIDVGSVNVNEGHNGFDAALRHSDGAILLASWTLIDNAAADLRTWTITPTSIASPGVSAGANVLTDTGESGCAAIAINQQNDDVYVAYALGGTWASNVDVKYKVSTDGMATWGTQQDYSETTDDIKRISGPRSIGDSGGRIQWAWYNDDLNDVYVNLVNDVEIAEPATVHEKDLAGSLPAMQGVLTKAMGFALAGSLPAMSGALSLGVSTTVAGNLPPQSGDLSVKLAYDLAGTLPPMDGDVAFLKEKAFLAGSLPAMQGTLSIEAALAVLGNLPAMSGALFAGQTAEVAGVLPAMSGDAAFLRDVVKLAGSLPPMQGEIVKAMAAELAGSLPAMSGEISIEAFMAVLGNLPAMSGVVVSARPFDVSGVLPAMAGLIGHRHTEMHLLGILPPMSGTAGKSVEFAVAGALPQMAGLVAWKRLLPFVARAVARLVGIPPEGHARATAPPPAGYARRKDD